VKMPRSVFACSSEDNSRNDHSSSAARPLAAVLAAASYTHTANSAKGPHLADWITVPIILSLAAFSRLLKSRTHSQQSAAHAS